jgi:hypothetical protein
MLSAYYHSIVFSRGAITELKNCITLYQNKNKIMKNLKRYWDFFKQLSSQMNPINKIIGLPILMLTYLIAATFMKTVKDH